MKNHIPFHTGLMLLASLLASCSTMQPTGQVRDDVYFMPSEAPMTASNGTGMPSASQPQPDPAQLEQMEVVDDYFDSGTSEQLGTSRGYYDMAYNDPYYYNYGRFGFGSGMGMGGMNMGHMSGWSSPGWGMGMGWGNGDMGWGNGGMGWGNGGMGWGNGGMGWGNGGMGWGNGGMGWGNGGMGWGNGGMGWGNGGMGWYDPWDPWNRWTRWNNPHWMGGGFNQWNSGMGGGPYWGPYGNSTNWYAPVVVGGSSNVYIGHRSSLGSGGNSGTGGNATTTTRPSGMVLRDPVSLDPVRREAAKLRGSSTQEQRRTIQQRPAFPATTTPRSIDRRENAPNTAPQLDRRQQQRTSPSRTSPERSIPSRNFDQQQRSGGFDRGTSPSRSPSNGGSRPSGPPRPR